MCSILTIARDQDAAIDCPCIALCTTVDPI
jgi:hypothetical protein